MQTYSHFIWTAALNGRFGQRLQIRQTLPPINAKALLLGSVLPDLPLITISIFAIGYDILAGNFADGPPGPDAPMGNSITQQLFDVWFFENPWVITAHNLFHSPLLVVIFMLIGLWGFRRGKKWGAGFFWLSAAAMLHTLIDIPLHVTDGPLLLFPLNWTWRFRSPISYWDPNFYGREWSIFEHLLDLALLVSLFVRYRPDWRAWRQRRKAT
ncbi:MAG: hypothetical protein DHS20C20_10030 [Ardenticatenaceae bacterium]|nr:MAG: hypothetical protein DHS20C20_10030 [Ardenticatenaceae bacterium]